MGILKTIIDVIIGFVPVIAEIISMKESSSSKSVGSIPNRLFFSLSYEERTRLRKRQNRIVICCMLALAASICILVPFIIQSFISMISMFFRGLLGDKCFSNCLLCVLLTLLIICILGFIIIYFRLENKKSFERHIKTRRQEMHYTIACISLISLVLVFSSLVIYYINNEDMTSDLFIIAIGLILVAAYTVYLSYGHMNEHRIKEYSENKAFACFEDKSGSITYIFHCMESGNYLCSKKDNLIDADELFIVKRKYIMNMQIKPHENPINEYYQIEQPDNEK